MFELNPIIENPRQKGVYDKYLQDKRDKILNDKKKLEEQQLKEEMKAKLNKKEYNVWLANEYYRENKEKVLEKYKDKKLKNLKLNLEEYEDLAKEYPPEKKEREKELELLEKYKGDFTNSQGRFVQYWWCTPIWFRWKKLPMFKKPIKIIPNPGINGCITQRLNIQQKVYNFVKPYLNEIHKNEYAPKEKQDMFCKLQYTFKPNTKIFELHQTKGISQNVLAMVVDAVLRDKWIGSLPYMGMCILCGDRVYTSMGQVFMVSPYNNGYDYINENNIDDIHNETQKFLKKKIYKCTLARAYNGYLLKVPREFIQNEEGEKEILSYDYYILPY